MYCHVRTFNAKRLNTKKIKTYQKNNTNKIYELYITAKPSYFQRNEWKVLRKLLGNSYFSFFHHWAHHCLLVR